MKRSLLLFFFVLPAWLCAHESAWKQKNILRDLTATSSFASTQEIFTVKDTHKSAAAERFRVSPKRKKPKGVQRLTYLPPAHSACITVPVLPHRLITFYCFYFYKPFHGNGKRGPPASL